MSLVMHLDWQVTAVDESDGATASHEIDRIDSLADVLAAVECRPPYYQCVWCLSSNTLVLSTETSCLGKPHFGTQLVRRYHQFCAIKLPELRRQCSAS